MEKINTDEIRGEWQEIKEGNSVAGGNDTIESIQMVAEKVNEIIDWINTKQLPPNQQQ